MAEKPVRILVVAVPQENIKNRHKQIRSTKYNIHTFYFVLSLKIMFIVLQTVYNWLVRLCASCYRSYVYWTTYQPVPDPGKEMDVLPSGQLYINKHKTRFLSTFEEPLASSRNWNENMGSLSDPATVAQELMYADNTIEPEWKRRVLIENTPRGNVIMYYDVYKQGFAYYCDQSTMPYDIMNAVAMKYVLTFSCRDLFVDDSVVPMKVMEPTAVAEDPAKTKTNSPDTKSEKKDTLPFAKFKTYNTAAKTKSKQVIKKINKFIHLGQIRNYSPLNKPPKVFATNGFATKLLPEAETKQMNLPKLSYAEFKAQQQLQKEEEKKTV